MTLPDGSLCGIALHTLAPRLACSSSRGQNRSDIIKPGKSATSREPWCQRPAGGPEEQCTQPQGPDLMSLLVHLLLASSVASASAFAAPSRWSRNRIGAQGTWGRDRSAAGSVAATSMLLGRLTNSAPIQKIASAEEWGQVCWTVARRSTTRSAAATASPRLTPPRRHLHQMALTPSLGTTACRASHSHRASRATRRRFWLSSSTPSSAKVCSQSSTGPSFAPTY